MLNNVFKVDELWSLNRNAKYSLKQKRPSFDKQIRKQYITSSQQKHDFPKLKTKLSIKIMCQMHWYFNRVVSPPQF